MFFKTPRSPRAALPAAVLMSTVLVLSACGEKPGAEPATGAASGGGRSGPSAAASAPPVTVSTVRATQRDLAVQITTTGTVTPLASVEVRPQSTNPVLQVHVKEGQFVRKGELLFTLDARADEAKLAQARAQLAKDQAGLNDAQRQLTRSRELLAQNFVSQGAVDSNQAQFEAQQALVAADRAAIDAARLSLSYARITAPAAGRLGAINVFPGSSVQANTTTLVSVTQLDPISVAFSLPQRHLSDALGALKDGGAAVSATMPETQGPPLQGRLQFVDNAVDVATGTVKVKAMFDNSRALLWPGAFVNVAMTARTLAGAVVIPQAAIIQSARGTTVYVVQDGKAVARPIELLYAAGGEAAVGGVKPGERIVLDGRQNLRPGTPVVERARDGARAASGAASGGAPGSAPGNGARSDGAVRGPAP